jgi:hypothetical protein
LKDKPFEVIDWPGNSADLNLIENAWNFMKKQEHNYGHLLSSQAEGSHPQDVDSGHQQGLPGQPQQLHAQED